MLKNTPAQYKEKFPFLKEVDSLALANAQQNLEKSYKNFFRDKSVGFPKFKSKHYSKASYTTNNQGGNIRIENGRIKLSKIGFVRLKQHCPFEGIIKSCTISMNKSGRYFVSILVKSEEKETEVIERKIGVDLGISHFAITTNDLGETKKHKNPKHLYKSEKKLKKAQRSLSRKQKGGKNRHKARLKVAKKHEKIANQGLNQVIAVSEPVLQIVYPIVMTAVFLVFFTHFIPSPPLILQLPAGLVTVVSVLGLIHRSGWSSISWLEYLPLFENGFEWLPLMIVGCVLGFIIGQFYSVKHSYQEH